MEKIKNQPGFQALSRTELKQINGGKTSMVCGETCYRLPTALRCTIGCECIPFDLTLPPSHPQYMFGICQPV